VPPSFYWDNTMADFLDWVEGARERKENEQYFSMYQTSLLYNTLRNQWGKNDIITVEELLGKEKKVINEVISLSDFSNKEQFDEYMKKKRGENNG
jgi:N-acetylneuraminic acid mutarotase